MDLWSLVFGHMLGDYFFQTHLMATKKTSSHKWCLIHCAIYTLCVALTIGQILNPLVWLIVFATHYPLDRYSLAYRFMQLKGGPDMSNPFAPIIYVAIDNTAHIALMAWLLEKIV